MFYHLNLILKFIHQVKNLNFLQSALIKLIYTSCPSKTAYKFPYKSETLIFESFPAENMRFPVKLDLTQLISSSIY